MFALNDYYNDYRLWKQMEYCNKIIRQRVIATLFSNFIQDMVSILFYQAFKNKKYNLNACIHINI